MREVSDQSVIEAMSLSCKPTLHRCDGHGDLKGR